MATANRDTPGVLFVLTNNVSLSVAAWGFPLWAAPDVTRVIFARLSGWATVNLFFIPILLGTRPVLYTHSDGSTWIARSFGSAGTILSLCFVTFSSEGIEVFFVVVPVAFPTTYGLGPSGTPRTTQRTLSRGPLATSMLAHVVRLSCRAVARHVCVIGGGGVGGCWIFLERFVRCS